MLMNLKLCKINYRRLLLFYCYKKKLIGVIKVLTLMCKLFLLKQL